MCPQFPSLLRNLRDLHHHQKDQDTTKNMCIDESVVDMPEDADVVYESGTDSDGKQISDDDDSVGMI